MERGHIRELPNFSTTNDYNYYYYNNNIIINIDRYSSAMEAFGVISRCDEACLQEPGGGPRNPSGRSSPTKPRPHLLHLFRSRHAQGRSRTSFLRHPFRMRPRLLHDCIGTWRMQSLACPMCRTTSAKVIRSKIHVDSRNSPVEKRQLMGKHRRCSVRHSGQEGPPTHRAMPDIPNAIPYHSGADRQDG